MLSSRNDWNYNAGMDESLNMHRGGGGYLCGINNTPYSFTMLYIKIFGGYVFSSLAKRFGGFVYSAHDTVLFRQHTFVPPFLRAFKSFSWGMHIPAGDQQVYL